MTKLSKSRWRRARVRSASIVAALVLVLGSLSTVTSGFGNAAIVPGVIGINAVTSRVEAERDRVYDAVADAGFRAIRLHVEWPVIEPYPGHYSWEETDALVQDAVDRGMQVLGVLTYTPAWAATAEGRKYLHPAPADPQQFADFSKLAAQRYKGKIRYWEVWNEPNVETHWAPEPNGKAYADLLVRTYTALKAVDADNFVITGGTSPTVDTDVKISPDTFIRQVYASGAGDHFDAIAMHPYSTPKLLSEAGEEYSSNSNISQVRAIMGENGQAAKRIWFTEFGAPTVGGHEFGVNEQRQALILLDGVNYMQGLPFAGPIFLFDYQDIDTDNPWVEMHYGLVRSDFTEKPALEAVRRLLEGN